jgi:putative transposase
VKKKRFSVEQITAVLQQAEGGVSVGDVCRQVGISEQTYYRWKKVYGGMPPSEARELKQLREENGKLKRLVADLSLDKVMLQDVVQKNVWSAPRLQGHAAEGTQSATMYPACLWSVSAPGHDGSRANRS